MFIHIPVTIEKLELITQQTGFQEMLFQNICPTFHQYNFVILAFVRIAYDALWKSKKK